MLKFRVLLIVLLLTAGTAVYSQSSQVLYFMDLPQKSTLNPALKPTGRTFVGLPGISDISVRLDNNFLSFSDLFSGGVISDTTLTFLEGGPWVEQFAGRLGKNNSLVPRADVRLFGLAFTLHDDIRLSLDITTHAGAGLNFPGDMLRLGLTGNDNFIGRSLDLSSFRFDMNIYNEIGLGASFSIADNFRVGGRIKVLSGIATAHMRNNRTTLTVNSDGTHTANADIVLNVSAPVSFTTEDDGSVHGMEFHDDQFNSLNGTMSYLLGMANPGAGIDLGAEYRINDLFAVSAALNNLGFIRWKRDLSRLTIDATFDFNGLTMQDVYDGSVEFFDELLNWAIDSIQEVMVPDVSPPPFTTALPTSFVAAFSYKPVNFFTAGVLSQTQFGGGRARQSVTLSGNFNFGNAFSTSLAYTIANRRYDNIGFGIAARGGYTQFFAMVDNIPLRWTRVTNSSGTGTYPLPENWYTVHVRLGLNLVFGNRQPERPLPPM